MYASMSAALTILLLTVAGHEPSDPFTPAVARATREALGWDTQVVLRALPDLPSDADAASLAAELQADVVVELSWSLPDHLRATIHLRRSANGRWFDREVGFRAVDEPAERGRTVAFMVVSMLPERLPGPATTSRSETRSADRGTNQAAIASSPTTVGLPHAGAVAGMVIAATGVGDHGGGIGGALDLRARLYRALTLRFGVAARVGSNPPSQTSTRVVYGSAGMAWDAWTRGRTALGIRWDALLLRADFAHEGANGIGTERRGKWMTGFDLVLEATQFLDPQIAIVVGAGGEATLGKTDIFLGDGRITTIEPLRPVLELGLRAVF